MICVRSVCQSVPVEVRGLLVKWVLSYHMDLRNKNQVCRFGGKHLYPMSYLLAQENVKSIFNLFQVIQESSVPSDL